MVGTEQVYSLQCISPFQKQPQRWELPISLLHNSGGLFLTHILDKGQVLGVLVMDELVQGPKPAPRAEHGPCDHSVIPGAVAAPSTLLEAMGHFWFWLPSRHAGRKSQWEGNGWNLLPTAELLECLKKEPRGFSLCLARKKKRKVLFLSGGVS